MFPNIQSLRKLKIPENSREKIPPLIILSTEQPFKDDPTGNVQGVINAAKAANEEGVRIKWKTTSSLTNVIYNVEELEYALYELSKSNSVDDRGFVVYDARHGDFVQAIKYKRIKCIAFNATAG